MTAGAFNRFACELSLERFAQKYDAARGKFEAYNSGRGPGSEGNGTSAQAHNERNRARRKTFASVQQVAVYAEGESPRHTERNDIMPTAAELLEIAEKLEAYVRRLDGVQDNGLPDVRFGHSYSQQSRSSDSKTQSAWQMPLERLQERVAKQRLLVAKWESRLAESAGTPKESAARKRVAVTSAKLHAAESILKERE